MRQRMQFARSVGADFLELCRGSFAWHNDCSCSQPRNWSIAVKRNRRREGMTLIEIMVVLLIMSAIASAVGFAVISNLRKAHERETATRARTIQTAVIAYVAEKPAECPTMQDLLQDEILDKTTDHRDAWGHAFTIECDGSTAHVRSSGQDGQMGTGDDIGF
jgi:general secretion pathway protein G